MIQIMKTILIFIAIIALNSKAIESLNFCESFHNNENHFDYGYQPNETQYYYLFIGQNYWQLSVNESAQTVHLLPQSRQSDWFGNQYRFAIRGDFYDHNNTMITMAGLIHKNNDSIDWALILVDPDTTSLSLIDNGMQRTSHFSLEQGFVPSVAFDYGVFIQQVFQRNGSRGEYLRSFRSMNFEARTFEAYNDTEFIERMKEKMDHANITYGSDDTIIDNIRGVHEIMAAFTTGEGIFLLLKEDSRILYCFSIQYFANLGCHTQPQVLVDCTPPNLITEATNILEAGT